MIELALLLLNTLIWCLLALAMPKHSRNVLGKAPTRAQPKPVIASKAKQSVKPLSHKQQITLRTTATAGIILGTLASTHHWGPAEGLILYTVSLAPPGLLVVFAVAYLPKKTALSHFGRGPGRKP